MFLWSPLWLLWKCATCCLLFCTENAACEGWGILFARKEGEFLPQTQAVLWGLWQRGRSLPAVQGSRTQRQHGSTTFHTVFAHLHLLICRCTQTDLIHVSVDELWAVLCSPFTQAWGSDDDEPPFSPVMRKKAVKVKHVKRREKKFDKKVRFLFPHEKYC